MSHDKDPECRGWLIRETPDVMEISTDKSEAGPRWWIPRSQIGHLRNTEIERGQTYVNIEIVFTIPEWLIEKKQCWELVP